MSTPSLKRIAATVGVSESTVSRVLSGQAKRYRISDATAERILTHARDENFVPNSLARSLRLKRSHTIGLVIPDITNPFFAGVAREIASAARRQGYSIILSDSEEDTDLEAEALRVLRSRNVEGIVLCPVGLSSGHLRQFAQSSVPVVQADRFFTDLPWPYVACDNRAGARALTAHLLDQGYRRIACIQGLPGSSTNDLRVAGYRDALGARGCRDEIIVGHAFTERSGFEHTERLLTGPERPDAVLALGNLIALGCMRAIAKTGLSIPRDVALGCFDDQPYAEWLAAPLTTVVQPIRELGELAASRLFEAIREPKRPPQQHNVLLPTQLVTRASTSARPLTSSPNQ